MPVRSANMWRTSRNIFANVAVFAMLLLAPAASAQGLGGFTIESFRSDITVNTDGSFDVVETLRGEFFEDRHGLFRYIPDRYQNPEGGNVTVPIDIRGVTFNGGSVPYEVFREGQNKVVKIGDPDETVIGPFEYVIAYRVERAIIYGEDTDEFYWNVTGTQSEEISNVTARIEMPVKDGSELKVQCFTGSQESRAQDCEVGRENKTVVVTADKFLTVSVRFPKGVVAEPSASQEFSWWLRDNWDKVFTVIFIPGSVFLLAWVWWRHGRDVKGRGTIIAEYDPPDGLRPTEIGTLLDTKVHPADFSAGIVDLAVRGYFQIVEEEEKGMFGARRAYKFKKLKEANEVLKPFEKEIFDALFGGGDEATLKAREINLAKARNSAVNEVPKALTSEGYFAKHPATVKTTFLVIGIAFLFLGWFVGIAAAVDTDRFRILGSLLLVGVLFLIIAPFMPKKTKKGTLAFEHAKGFKLFLETAEKYRMQWQEKEGIFEKFLPYAMVFGVVEKWAAVFKDMNLPQPTWYMGAVYPIFNPVDFGNHVSSLGIATNSVQLPSTRGSGGGFSGGFSGGGFGGGGVGSW